jgi:hypothetical protein
LYILEKFPPPACRVLVQFNLLQSAPYSLHRWVVSDNAPLPPTVLYLASTEPCTSKAISDEPAMAPLSSTLRTCFFSLGVHSMASKQRVCLVQKKKGLGHLCGYALHELVSGCLGFSKHDALKQGTYERRFQGPISTSKSTFHEIRLARKSEAVGGRQIRNRLLAIPLWRGSKLL